MPKPIGGDRGTQKKGQKRQGGKRKSNLEEIAKHPPSTDEKPTQYRKEQGK